VKKMPRYRLTYRDEFSAVVQAENAQTALEKFKAGQVESVKVIGELWNDFLEIENLDTRKIVKETGWDIRE